MIDYLLDLLAEVEAVLGDADNPSLALPQENETRTLQSRKALQKERGAEASELLAERLLHKNADRGRASRKKEASRTRTASDTASEEMLEKALRRGRTLATQAYSAQGKEWWGNREQSSFLPGAFLLQKMQQKSRLAETGVGVRFAPSELWPVREEWARVPSYLELSAFDRAIERDARCYDNGFSLL